MNEMWKLLPESQIGEFQISHFEIEEILRYTYKSYDILGYVIFIDYRDHVITNQSNILTQPPTT